MSKQADARAQSGDKMTTRIHPIRPWTSRQIWRPGALAALLIILMLPVAHATTAGAGLDAGNLAPTFSLPSLRADAPDISLEGYRGKVLYVDFWASWCGPCRKSLPQLNQLRSELGEQGFEIIAVNVDEFVEDALAFLERYPVDYPLAYDGDGSIAKLYKVRGMPTSYLVNRRGELVYIHEGFRDGDIDDIRSKVTALLAQ